MFWIKLLMMMLKLIARVMMVVIFNLCFHHVIPKATGTRFSWKNDDQPVAGI